jgi:hypothetical protein
VGAGVCGVGILAFDELVFLGYMETFLVFFEW